MERLKKSDVLYKIDSVNHLTGRNFILYSAYGQYGVREEGTHIMPGMGSLREVYTFLTGMLAALDVQRGAL